MKPEEQQMLSLGHVLHSTYLLQNQTMPVYKATDNVAATLKDDRHGHLCPFLEEVNNVVDHLLVYFFVYVLLNT